jgi:pyrroloquinoline-quinone synthase
MSETSHSKNVVASLDSMAADFSLLKHPFYQQWTAGELSSERLRNYATQYYRHVAAFPRYLSALHSRCDDLATRRTLLENLIEEEGGPENHPDLWLRFAEALGLEREDVVDAKPLPAAEALVETFTHLTREAPLAAGLAALYVYESQVAEVAAVKIDGLKRFYGIADEAGLRFFAVHREADVDHACAIARLIERHSETAQDVQMMLDAGGAALRAVWDLLDCV